MHCGTPTLLGSGDDGDGSTTMGAGTRWRTGAFVFGLALATTAMAQDATQDITSGSTAPTYESRYTRGARLSGSAEDTPEADGRPGEYYFLKGAEAFQKKEYSFSIQMYEVAASWAFKPAEYNLGVIYARGQGVAADLPRGMAWMMLASERGDERYVAAREVVNSQLSKEQARQANEIWRDLKTTYGDEVALKRARARWAEVRSHMTGSRVGSVGHLSVGMPGQSLADPSGAKPASQQTGRNQGPRSTGTTPGDAAGAQAIDGAVAYRQLLESNDPYDPKFERLATGTATVGDITTVGPNSDPQGNGKVPEKHDR